MSRRTKDEAMGVCKRCGQPVHEHHSHIMLVPVGRGRMFYHAGCEPIRRSDVEDGDKPSVEGVVDRASLRG
jgi:hypothetical protein